MNVTAIQCKKCKTIVYSRARHDMRYCSCGAVAIDSGFDYTKVSGNCEDYVLLTNCKVRATKQQLYADWSSGRAKYGIVSKNQMKYKSGKHTEVTETEDGVFVTSTNVQIHLFSRSSTGKYIYGHKCGGCVALRIQPRDWIQKPVTSKNGTTHLIISYRLAKQIYKAMKRVNYEEI